MKATGWQAHGVRGFLSIALRIDARRGRLDKPEVLVRSVVHDKTENSPDFRPRKRC